MVTVAPSVISISVEDTVTGVRLLMETVKVSFASSLESEPIVMFTSCDSPIVPAKVTGLETNAV